MGTSNGSVRPVWTLLAVLAALLLAASPGPLMLEWMRDPTNANAVLAIAAIAQAVGAIVLIGVTCWNVWLTRKISEATESQSQATVSQAVATTRAVELAQEQRRDTVRPVLFLALRGRASESTPDTLGLRLQLTNVGLGPAFDIRPTFVDVPFREIASGSLVEGASAAILRVGAELWFDFGRAVGSTWPGPGREHQVIGSVLVTYRDSLDGVRATRADLVATWHLAPNQPYELELRSQRFDPES